MLGLNIEGRIVPILRYIVGRLDYEQRALVITYIAIVVFGAVLGGTLSEIDPYFTNKRNLLNLVFAKWSLAWTLPSLFAARTIVNTNDGRKNRENEESFPLTSGSSLNWKTLLENIRNQLSYAKLYSIIIYWYLTVHIIFPYISRLTTRCTIKLLPDKTALCPKTYVSHFDVSGHSFLMTLLSASIFEEYKLLNRTCHPETIRKNPKFKLFKLTLNVYLTLAGLIWITMLLATSSYFHTFLENLTGIAFALAHWYCLYSRTYPTKIKHD